MREIKFRIWNPNANKFVAYSGVNEMPLHEAGALILKVPVYEVLQYTGLKDRNGVEIFEDDIVQVTDGDENIKGVGAIEFLPYDCWYITGDIHDSLSDVNYQEYLEVIGNIHENPELLSK